MQSELTGTSLTKEDKRLLEQISVAIRQSPQTFMEGGLLLDEDFSPSAFRSHRARQLQGFREERLYELAQRDAVVRLLESAGGTTVRDVVEGVPGIQHSIRAEQVLDELVRAGFAVWGAGATIKPSQALTRRRVDGRSEESQALPPPKYTPIVIDILHDWRWRRGAGQPAVVPRRTERLSGAIRELTGLSWPLEAPYALAICVLAWLISDPEASEFTPRVTEFQEIPWSPGATDTTWEARMLTCHLDRADREDGLLAAARDAVARLKSIGNWPLTDEVSGTAAVVDMEVAAAKIEGVSIEVVVLDALQRHFPQELLQEGRSPCVSEPTPKPLRGEALDAAAAGLLCKNPHLTKVQIAQQLGVSKQRLSDPVMKSLALVVGQVNVERGERRERLRGLDRKGSLPARDGD